MFNLQLSVSTQVARDKKAAMAITQFEVKDIVVDEAILKALFTRNNYSTNQWKDGKCKNSNFLRMSGITLDIDKDITIVQAQELFKEFNHIIHSSTSHRADIPSKGGVQDRFRVILPFDPATYDNITTEPMAEAIYAFIISKYNFVDASCKDPARKYFPFLNKDYPELFVMHINDVGNYISITAENLKEFKATETKEEKKEEDYVLTLDQEVILTDGKTTVRIGDLPKTKTPCYCVFCDDINSANASAFVAANQQGRKFLACSHCLKTYWVSLPDSYPELFYIGRDLMRVYQTEVDVFHDKCPTAYLNYLDPSVRRGLEHHFAVYKNLAATQFQVEKMVDPTGSKVRWRLDAKAGKLQAWFPPIPEKVRDNAFVNKWLFETFGKYTDFIKMWMAIWSHHNFQGLPMIILNGPRRAGKSTFAEFLQNMYPSLSAEWGASETEFTDYKEKKLLIIEEKSLSEKRDHYEEIKKITGVDSLTVNKKHYAPYRVRNNVSVIMISNHDFPMYFSENERPTGTWDNQFFMLTLSLPKKINARIKYDLKDRAGYYVRTELREIYEKWLGSTLSRDNRYGLPCPLTDELLDQYDNADTQAEYDADKLIQAAVAGIMVTKYGSPAEKLGPFEQLNVHDMTALARVIGLSTTHGKTLREKLQKKNYIVKKPITVAGIKTWKILKDNVNGP
jgi:hypothetical protein